MKLSKNTVEILKNFSQINQNILVKSGSSLRTMSTMKNILGEASITEDFPKEFGIYDLNEFLGVVSLVNDADIEFGDNYLTVNGGKTKIRYFYSDPSILTTPPDTFNAPECDVSFKISQETLENVLKASAVMQLPDVVVVPGKITSTDLKNTTSNNYNVDIDTLNNPDFKFHFKADNLTKIKAGDYTFSASTEAGVSNWYGQEANYWIAMEATTD
jgi:hypothetical protein|tara:strand:- start:2845 stop:3489 length:645 start_codon:yes stop_codon:yes gene_type:complete